MFRLICDWIRMEMKLDLRTFHVLHCITWSIRVLLSAYMRKSQHHIVSADSCLLRLLKPSLFMQFFFLHFFPIFHMNALWFYGIITIHHAQCGINPRTYATAASMLNQNASRLAIVLHRFCHYLAIKSFGHVWILMEPPCINNMHCCRNMCS